ncbi:MULTISPECIES: SigE family RNA polymerase sigma factor [unclassified Nocardioides]|uniref:SigE family RNA polymerase sigma factor n=1 Tax=unclassified Nocardioides TaxID=2615069 RepID=UPI001F618D9B|nr:MULTISPECIES: SigE family RNA polymerase sigma factor [unclassified Nocardioides]
MTITKTDVGPTAGREVSRVQDFDELVAATGRQLHRAALLLTGGDHHLAEDLLQTTYAKVYASWSRVSRADDPVAYTRTVLTRTFLSHRRLRRSSEQPSDELPERAADPPDRAVRLDLVAALQELSAADRVVVVHRYWLDRSVAETARELRISETAVRTRSRRALARLRLHLTDLDEES